MSKPRAVVVYFAADMDGNPLKKYSYKLPDNVKVSEGDYVVVPTGPKEQPKLGRVYIVQDDFDWKPGIAWKWIIQKVDMSTYQTLKLLGG